MYQWKVPTIPVSAQTAGEEFERIYEKNGKLDPEDVVDESREEKAPLHPCFEWNDVVAAEKYRVSQAGNMIRCLVKVEATANAEESVEVRAFVHVEQSYHPITVAIKNVDMCAELLAMAERDMEAFKRKYSTLKQLSQVMAAIDNYREEKEQ